MLFNYQPHDYAQTYLQAFKLRGIAMGSCALAVAITAGAIAVESRHIKTLLFTSALGLTIVSRAAEDARTVSDRIALDYTDISDSARQQNLYESLTSEAEPLAIEAAIEPSVRLYDLSNVASENHLAVVGPTGSGKSFLAQHL